MSAWEPSIASRNADLKGSMDPNGGVPDRAEFRALEKDPVHEDDSPRRYGDPCGVNGLVPCDIPDSWRD
ncbi:hypothetical protein QFZ46_000795 [Microbacterium murale]|uniref:Uncharacterized protein n=1 Tax=Microbacterium murale TaxID=1081040 RepID=A0ABU0P5M8_9MICO|nr:hypothetical protein [Microbacterium murale]